MIAAVSRAMMSLAARGLGTERRDWWLAMEAEFETAVEDGQQFAFAAGCLIAAGRELVNNGQGRLVVGNYTLALGLLIPIAALQFERAIGVLELGGGTSPYLVWSQTSAVPIFMILWLLLGLAQFCLAWVLVEGDWTRVVKLGAVISAVTVTLLLFAGMLMLDLSSFVFQAAELGIELAAIAGAARWQARLVSNERTELIVY
jgi:hypothetical protein